MNVAVPLDHLVETLKARPELGYKQDIQLAARAFGRETRSAFAPAAANTVIVNGDDTAALPDGGEYVLFAAEGMRGEFVAADPWFAGFCSVLTNVNDVAAMGGRPWAVVDVLFLGSGENERVLEGMAAASAAFGVPVRMIFTTWPRRTLKSPFAPCLLEGSNGSSGTARMSKRITSSALN